MSGSAELGDSMYHAAGISISGLFPGSGEQGGGKLTDRVWVALWGIVACASSIICAIVLSTKPPLESTNSASDDICSRGVSADWVWGCPRGRTLETVHVDREDDCCVIIPWVGAEKVDLFFLSRS